MTEETIFAAALEKKTPTERAAYLDGACGTDAAFRQRVEALLRSHDEAGGFLAKPALAGEPTGPFRPVDEGPVTVIGPYKLLQKIGEGGFGVVFMAEQTAPVRRMVALKIIKPGMDTAQVIARFESERQALALMDHPNIARVLDAGATEIVGVPASAGSLVSDSEDRLKPGLQPAGRPYFVMELVKGIPVTEFCDKNHLPPEARLKLFIDVCHAIQHAHHKGIVHRDIKPSNVMVPLHDGVPVVKVIDFGVAKATVQKLTEKTLFTAYGQMIGTPAYMSPEQAEMSGLDIDTRSDVYSLGVLLYELLTGTTPLESKRLREAGYAEMQRLIREEEAPRPSTRLSSLMASRGASAPGLSAEILAGNRGLDVKRLVQLLAGDLDWLVMKALEKDRNRRYGTPGSFAEDIERYLRREAILARQPSTVYKLKKFAQRNRAAVLTAAAILFVLLAGIAGTTFGLFRAELRRLEAEQARAEEAEQRKKAEQAEADTLADYRASTDDAIEQLISSKPELGPKERKYLENTLKRWQAFAARQGDDERSRAIRAEGHFNVARVWQKLGRREEALSAYQTARDTCTKLVEQFPAVPKHQQDLTTTHSNLGILLDDLGRREEAQAEYQAARDIGKKLVERFPAVPGYREGLATTRSNLGVLLAALGKREEAWTEYQSARDLQKKLVEQFLDVPMYQQDLARTHHNLGLLLTELGRREEALSAYLAARDLGKKLLERFPAVPEYQQELARTHSNLGNLLAELGKAEEALAAYQAARALGKKLVEQFPAVPAYQQGLAATHMNLGVLLRSFRKVEDARTEYLAARELEKKLVVQFPAVPAYRQALATTHMNLGVLLHDLGESDEARTEYVAACDILKKLVEQFPTMPVYQHTLARTHYNLGILLAVLGKGKEALVEYQAACDVGKKLVEQYPAVSVYRIDLGGSYCNYGNLIRGEGKPAESLAWYDQAIRTLQPLHDSVPRDVTAMLFLRNSHQNRALAYDRLQRFAEAVKDWDRAIELSPPAERPEHRAARAIPQVQSGLVAEAVAEVAELTQSSNWNAAQWYNFACVYAVASGKIAEKKQKYAVRAMELLQKAVKAGYKDAAHMAKDKDLDALRERADFKRLIAELEKK